MLQLSGLNYIDTLVSTPLLKLQSILFFLNYCILQTVLKLCPEYKGQFIPLAHINLLMCRDCYAIGRKRTDGENELGRKE